LEFAEFFDKQATVEAALKNYLPRPNQFEHVAYEAMKYSLMAGGKRFRPVLLLMCYQAFARDFEKALPSACALEFVHTYSLIHDDLPAMDNDDLRRGQPTCHKKYDEAVALLAGDALFAEAFNLITSHQQGQSEVLVQIIRDLAEATGASGMVGGQVLDVCLTGQDKVSAEELFLIHSHKTGKLIVAAAKIGARLAGATESQLKAIENYAFNLGMAFQITDDILDEVGDSALLGKTAGSDRRHKKITYPSIFGLEKAKSKAVASSQKAIESLEGIKGESLAKLAQFVVRRNS